MVAAVRVQLVVPEHQEPLTQAVGEADRRLAVAHLAAPAS